MGTIKRLNDQQKQQAQAEAAMPGAYENRYDEGIQNALAGMDSANSAGLGYDSQNGTYRGALSRLFGNAGPHKDGDRIWVQLFYRPAGGDHRGYRPGNVWHQLMIQLSDHADPHGAAAACELEIRLCVNVPVKLQRLLQRQQVII